jgi:hypothetical protein
MDKINDLINIFEKNINEKKINYEQSNLILLLGELTKYYKDTNLFNVNTCTNSLNNKEIDECYIRIKTLMPKYKFIFENKNNSCQNVANKLKSINNNLLEFFNNTISVTPQLFSRIENFDAALSNYDQNYFSLLRNQKIISQIKENNKLTTPINKKNRILIITFDDRKNVEYINLHNKFFTEYAEKYGYEYKFEHIYNENLNTNAYWYKIYLVKYYLDTNLYDYVMWIDSDTIILNNNVNLNDFLNSYSSDLFFCDDNQAIEKINAGIFIIKNSRIGKQYINDCINNFCNQCIKNGEKKLKGRWAATCYEQGVMNLVLIKDYIPYSTCFSLQMVLCSNNINVIKSINNIFILHYYDTNLQQRNVLFSHIYTYLKNKK